MCLIITRTYKDIQAKKKWLYTLNPFPLLVAFSVDPQQDIQCTYKRNMKERSCNHCGSGKIVSGTYCEGVCVCVCL